MGYAKSNLFSINWGIERQLSIAHIKNMNDSAVTKEEAAELEVAVA